ncbi:hypothetical protein [Agrobacterium pusense]|uniref:Uncharacterized protein n=1 Tax=Agrobacterium pusense TaxID=648995 RepID=A0A6H0ZIV1_9HYPH|nr:hypothetical protein [Agrobacterium pusense]QIX20746.1 hypothetical protein FOB41_06155 [Agrobacterium pusense]WCK22707.1 hypothetical protein CFBP5496_0008035 [Agrobacterium pusense]
MSEMIERVGRAIHAASEECFTLEACDLLARAAIEAMREPTKAQLEAAEDIVVGFDDFACGDGNIYLGIPGYPQKARDVWSALIDAALKDTV